MSKILIQTTEEKRKALLAFLDRVTVTGVQENITFTNIIADLQRPVTDFKEVDELPDREEGK